ncbi:acyltransferase [Parabacteroides johnsonii]|uniref:Maltose/galactoside acetyltransferase domain-containing protein n=1 Tax=Parabacteroides johnsonii CL02T12C29 TaxID=999419 RepID=K5Y1B4_9BACT|nr:acyltransferase [Parabacteroides johnsonii]EKN06837.1 hypothetical protein HMPREF1077_03105 [Parabacteroides johnsonii CL02T12C29]
MFIYKIVRAIQNWIFSKRGWVLGDNVTISIHGVKRIGGGKIYCANNVCINTYSLLIASSDIHIGENSTLAYRTLLTTNANPNAPYNKLCKIYPPLHKEIWIGDNVWVGAGAVILPGCRIGNNCVIAAGAVVCNDLPDNVMVAGVPAKIKKSLDFGN